MNGISITGGWLPAVCAAENAAQAILGLRVYDSIVKIKTVERTSPVRRTYLFAKKTLIF
jgi:hypothetical protein